MKHTKCYLIISLLLIFFLQESCLYAQYNTKSKKAIKYYEQAASLAYKRQYPEAIIVLKQALKKDQNFAEAQYDIARYYMFLNQYQHAKSHYQKLVELTAESKKYKNIYYNLANIYFRSEKYDSALIYIDKFLNFSAENVTKNIEKAQQLKRNILFANEHKKKPLSFTTVQLSAPLNQFDLQYFPVITADEQTLFFTARVEDSPSIDENIYVSTKNHEGNWSQPQLLSSNVNTSENEGTCTISADGYTLIFTACRFNNCDLFETKKIGDDWTIPQSLSSNINSPAWESQPALSADGRTLFFISNRKGGKGKRDIWMSNRQEDGSWGMAINLGDSINTKEDEVSPFIHVNGQVLFFASNGHPGFGGFDIYSSEKKQTYWSTPKNLGYPLNNNKDQISLIVTANGKKGFYTVEQNVEGKNTSKLYTFNIPASIQIQNKSTALKGKILDALSKKPLFAQIELKNLETGEQVAVFQSDSISGKYLAVLTEGTEYALFVAKKGYLYQTKSFNITNKKEDQITIDFLLSPAISGNSTVLNNLFFEFNQYQLKEKSRTALDQLVKFLVENPSIHVQISGHTDNVGTEKYNIQLSKKRAESVYHYLSDHGINKNRLSFKGYGASEPAVANDTEENRKLNRRIELSIIKNKE